MRSWSGSCCWCSDVPCSAMIVNSSLTTSDVSTLTRSQQSSTPFNRSAAYRIGQLSILPSVEREIVPAKVQLQCCAFGKVTEGLVPRRPFVTVSHSLWYIHLWAQWPGELKLQEWTLPEEIAGVDIAGVDSDGVH